MSKQNQRLRKFQLETKFEMNGLPYVAQGDGRDLDAILADAEYSIDCPDPKNFTSIGELPQAQFDQVCHSFAMEIADAREYEAEASA